MCLNEPHQDFNETAMKKNKTSKQTKPKKKTRRTNKATFTFTFNLYGTVSVREKDFVAAQVKLVNGIYKLLGHNISGRLDLNKIDGGIPICREWEWEYRL